MFILRRLTSQNVEDNTLLGSNYTIVDVEKNPKEYQKSLEAIKMSEDSDIYGFISCEEGSKLIPLYIKSSYFVMTGNGQTFANITRR